MAGLPIYRFPKQLAKNWWQALEEAGFSVTRTPWGGVVTQGRAKVKLYTAENDHLMLAYSAPLVFAGKNLRLAKAIENVLVKAGATIFSGP